MNWYYKLLAKRPYLVLLGVAVFSLACIIASFVCNKLPDFTDPTVGFEARGTIIGKRLTAWRNLLDESSLNGQLVANPKDVLQYDNSERNIDSRPKKFNIKGTGRKKKERKIKYENKLRRINKNQIHHFADYEGELDNSTDAWNRSEHWEYGRNLSFPTEELGHNLVRNKQKWADLRRPRPPERKSKNPKHGFFCDLPRSDYGHYVIESRQKHTSLFTVKNLLAICDIELTLTTINGYKSICQKKIASNECCRPWSIANYVALLNNKTSCFEIEESDVKMVQHLLLECYPYFEGLKLNADCEQTKCRVPAQCAQYNAVYNIFNFLSDVDFVKLNDTTVYLKSTMVFLPVARSTKALTYYHNLKKRRLTNKDVQVVAMDMGLKNALFDECLISDGWLIALGGLFIFVSMWLYTSSILVTLMTVIAILFSLGIAYFIYTVVFNLEFFPFMNLLAVIVVVGIGADDAFIFMKIWKCVLSDRVKSSGVPLQHPSNSFSSEATSHTDALAYAIGNTLKHAALSMLVTSITTAAAFYASYISSITAVRCFGIFAGTAVITNYILMVTWLPAAVAIRERLKSGKCKNAKIKKLKSPLKRVGQIMKWLENIVVDIVINMPLLSVVILGTAGIFSGVIVLYWPKLQLPDSPDFQLFVSSHPFEVYDSRYKDSFWFEKSYSSTESFKLPLRFVFGVKPEDDGNYLDPLSRGQLHFDPSFNVSSPKSQVWLLHFCQELKEQEFVAMSLGLLLPNCFIENFITWMGRRCIDDMSGINRSPCCEESEFPFSTEVFEACLPESISSLYETPREFFMPGVAGPKFARRQTIVRNDTVSSPVLAVVIEYDSSQLFTMSYTEMHRFVSTVEAWMQLEITSAPEGLQGAWFTSDLEFFDLQDTLSNGTLVAIGMAMTVALFVLLLVTLNVLISLYAIITVTFTIFTTIAILIAVGWKLNVLESVAVTTAIGLAVDFSLHYGVHYRLSPDPDRKSSVKFALSRMIQPTLMAALTTAMAGAFMLPSQVLAYIQIGIFLVVVMTVSWIYATFFLMSLLRLCGPEYGFWQFTYPKFTRSHAKKNLAKQIEVSNRIIQHQQSIASEQLLSASELLTSESHELDSLTSNSIIKPLEHTRPNSLINSAGIKKKYSYPRDHSPSIGSVVTVLPDDAFCVEHDNN